MRVGWGEVGEEVGVDIGISMRSGGMGVGVLVLGGQMDV